MHTFKDIITRGHLAVRSIEAPSNNVIDGLIALLSLIFFALVLASMYVLLKRARRRQRRQDQLLPQYEVKRTGNHRRLTIQTADGQHSVVVINGGKPMLANPQSPPHSPDNVPEIHITFPDEQDDDGRRKSGRVMVIRVGDRSVGLEPLHEEQLPAYEKEGKGQFYSIDMDQIGGLKEKDRSDYR